MVLVDRARVEVEDLRDHADLGARAGDRLADVARLDGGELLGVLLDERGEPPQQARAVGRRDGAPRGKCRPGARDRLVGLLDAGLLELGDRLLGGRVDDRQRHARIEPPARRHRFAQPTLPVILRAWPWTRTRSTSALTRELARVRQRSSAAALPPRRRVPPGRHGAARRRPAALLHLRLRRSMRRSRSRRLPALRQPRVGAPPHAGRSVTSGTSSAAPSFGRFAARMRAAPCSCSCVRPRAGRRLRRRRPTRREPGRQVRGPRPVRGAGGRAAGRVRREHQGEEPRVPEVALRRRGQPVALSRRRRGRVACRADARSTSGRPGCASGSAAQGTDPINYDYVYELDRCEAGAATA